MLDIKFIRENREVVKQAVTDKGVTLDLDRLLALDEQRRSLIQQVESLRQERNTLSDQVAREKDPKKREELIAKVKSGKERMGSLEQQLSEVEISYRQLMLLVPNIPDVNAPKGKDSEHNVDIYHWGEPRQFDFTPKDHVTLGEELGLLDLVAGAKTSGYRGYYLKNQGVLMHLGLIWLAINKMRERGFEIIIPPTIVKEFALTGSGHFPSGKEEIYQIANPGKLADGKEAGEPLYLVGTSEPSSLALAADKVYEEKDLPLKLCGFSQCYRSEIGSYGKDTKGIYRIHEFMKVEQVVICKADIAESEKWFKEMLNVSKEMLEEMEIPYRVLDNCTGDMGSGKYRMNDVEAWMPSRNGYGETHSNSNLTDWQARRLNIRYKDKDGNIKYAYTLNDTVIASPRVLIALWENHQQANGTITVPKALQPYVGADVITKP
ncbi:MAG: serine--tRNA ligase [bacterium]